MKLYCKEFEQMIGEIGQKCEVVGAFVNQEFCFRGCPHRKNKKNGSPKLIEYPDITPPTIPEMISNFAQATIDFVKSGGKLCPRAEYLRRLSICIPCHGGRRCPYCGCNMPIKAAAAVFECPKGYWDTTIAKPRKNVFVNAADQVVDDLVDRYHGDAVFLLLSGPRLHQWNIEFIKRHFFTMSVNNGGLFETDFWTTGDSPTKFDDTIWENPRIQKFVSIGKGNKPYNSTGRLIKTLDNMVYFKTGKETDIRSWLDLDHIAWAAPSGDDTILSVMILALHILYFLGFNTVYLLGADFIMTPDSAYAYEWDHSIKHCNDNNYKFRLVNRHLGLLDFQLRANGFNVFNCDPGSKCLAFRQINFDDVKKGVFNNG